MTAKKTTGSSAKHVSSAKHTTTSKHTPTATKKTATTAAKKVTTKAKPATHAKAAAFAVGDWLPVCSFEALAQSLRLAGQFVHDDEVAGLWELAGAPALGASVAAALDAASLHGLAGFRPQFERPIGVEGRGGHAQERFALPVAQDEAGSFGPFDDLIAGNFHGLILHVDVPGPHAVLATADGWWSWGELYSPWRCRISEAWAVSWS